MIESIILAGMIFNESYMKKVLPFIKGEYFDSKAYQVTYEVIVRYITKYNHLPTQEQLKIETSKLSTLNESLFKEVDTLIDALKYNNDTHLDWLVDETEKFCQDKALYNAIRESILILENKDKKKDKGTIPELVSAALAVSFDTNIGHDFLEDFEQRYDFYHNQDEKVAFDLDILNEITKGGASRKSLIVLLAPTGVGKTLFMCHMAAANLMAGKNVLYITCEMAEERISERIDANLLDISLDDLSMLSKEVYVKKMNRLGERTKGKLIVKEYATSTAHVNHFRHLLRELKLKKKFRPDIVYIDYLNICASARLPATQASNTFVYVKSIAEEIRSLAVEEKVAIISATQTNRAGAGNSDFDITNTSECIAVDQKVKLYNGEEKLIGDVVIGDQITSNDLFKTTINVHHKKIKSCVRITTQSGKSIVVSKDHVFPCKTSDGIARLSIKTGLREGDILSTK